MCSDMVCYSGNGNGGNPPDGIRNNKPYLSTSVCTQYVVSGREDKQMIVKGKADRKKHGELQVD